eukprot:TRINITY_DN544_c0_g2_i1.p1 TRINITY_DN544_c0_g2~~TRINITY_DN544_c0_g2_i1.p1  ORF type:complete len:532 (+),score=136.62 TRINITY_DN544_c0_g2_i1:127-1596(+)
MIEISTRPWLYALSQKYGRNISTLAEIPDEQLQNLVDQGYDMVWMMGVWELGPYGLNHDRTDPSLLQSYSQTLPGYTQEDIIGSPYAVFNYTLNPQLGNGDSDLAVFRGRLAKLGLRLMLDFVPNHSAVDAPLVSTNPEMYVHAPKGTNPPYDPSKYYTNGIAYGWGGYGDGWTDTLQFNYWNPDTVEHAINVLLFIASQADAIRCDVAYLVLNDQIQQNWGQILATWGYTRPANEFWSVAIKTVKQTYPSVVFLAEVYNPLQAEIQSVGFDFGYDKTLLDTLAGYDVPSIRGWITSNPTSFTAHSAHFLSNHDEPRAVPKFSGQWYLADAASFVTYTLPGMRFFWMWDDFGFSDRLDVHLRRETTEQPDQAVDTFYNKQLLQILSQHSAFRWGTWQYRDVNNNSPNGALLAWTWSDNTEKILCVINFTPNQGSGSIVLPDASPVNGNDTIPVTDLLSGTTWYRSAQEMKTSGLGVVINSWYAQILKYN